MITPDNYGMFFLNMLNSTHNNVPQPLIITRLNEEIINISNITTLNDELFCKKGFYCPLTLKYHITGYILPCDHIFSDEILKWNKKTCPCCRAEY